jgi:hypothetical protein
MVEAVARTTLNKARYFLSQAEILQADSDMMASGLPFLANLESAIIYGRSVLDHLRNELAPKDPTYRAWHDAKWRILESNGLFKQFGDRRNLIVHQEPEKANVTVSATVEFEMNMSLSVDLTVVRADGTAEPQNNVSKNPGKPPESKQPSCSNTTRTFYFSDPDCRAKSAIEYVQEFLDLIEPVVLEAETRFLG